MIDNSWFPNTHLCPVGPRVLDTCSLIYRTIHIQEVYGTPLSQSLIQSYFLGPQTSLRFYLRSCTYAMLLLYLRLCKEHTVLFRNCDPFSRYRHPEFSGSQSFTAGPTNLGSVSELAYFVAGVLQGVAP